MGSGVKSTVYFDYSGVFINSDRKVLPFIDYQFGSSSQRNSVCTSQQVKSHFTGCCICKLETGFNRTAALIIKEATIRCDCIGFHPHFNRERKSCDFSAQCRYGQRTGRNTAWKKEHILILCGCQLRLEKSTKSNHQTK